MRYSRGMLRSLRSRALKGLWTRSDASDLRPDWARRIERQLSLLEQATKPEDMDVVSYGFRALTGDRAGRFSIVVSRNWRISFGIDGEDAVDVDLEDYHGS